MTKSKEVTLAQNLPVSHNPDQFITMALEKGSDIAVLNGLFDLKQRYDADLAKKAFHRAMHEFQSIKPALKRTKEVSYGQGKAAYKFTPLSEIERELKDPLTTCGMTYRFENINREGMFGIRMVITHVDGHSEQTEMLAPSDGSGNKNAIQGIGSTSTYLMRYTLIAGFGLTTADEDDDGQASGDLPLLRLMEHNRPLQNPDILDAISGLKRALSENDLESAVEYVNSIGKDVITALWVAPTKGGIFTTEERAKMKSDGFASARREILNQDTAEIDHE